MMGGFKQGAMVTITFLDIMKKKGKVIVPHPKKDLKTGTLKNILKQAQITIID